MHRHLLFAALALTSAAHAQCPPNISATTAALPGVNGSKITAMLQWDPDGAGPQAPVLVVSGDFTQAGAVAAAGMATWDGQQWQPFPAPLANATALAFHNGELVAAPPSINAAPPTPAPVVRYDAASNTWQPLGTGLNNVPIKALAVLNDQLYAGGTGIVPSSLGARHLARLNGTTWASVTALRSSGAVHTLQATSDRLLIGGTNFTYGITPGGSVGASRALFAYSSAGHVFYPDTIDPAFGDGVRALAMHNGDLYAGTASGSIFRHNGTAWNYEYGFWSYDRLDVHALRSVNGVLYAGGAFWGNTNGLETNGMARKAADGWQMLDYEGLCFGGGWYGTVYSLAEFQGKLIFGSGYYNVFGSRPGIAAHDGAHLSGVTAGPDGPVNMACTFNGATLVGGQFTARSGVHLQGLATITGDTPHAWAPFAPGAAIDIPPVCSLVHNGELYIGGVNRSRDTTGLPVRRWNGSAWTAFGTGPYYGNEQVNALAFYNGQLIASGNFQYGSPPPDRRSIVRWDGANWLPLAGGLNGPVNDLKLHEDRLIAAGAFPGAVQAWDGTSWQTLGLGFDTAANALALYRGQLIAAGSFSASGLTPLNRIARWDGETWQSLGEGFPGTVDTLAVHDHRLFAFGRSDLTGLVARVWDGQAWTDLPASAFPLWTTAVDALPRADDLLVLSGYPPATATIHHACGPVCGTQDFNGDGDFGTDQDIEAFFACLGGSCCPTGFFLGSDFNDDGDAGTDADIEAFFRVLGGAAC